MVSAVPNKTRKPQLPPPREDDGNLTSVKCYRRLARIITMLGQHKDKSQQEVMELYSKLFEDDLLAEMARKTTEIIDNRKEPNRPDRSRAEEE